MSELKEKLNDDFEHIKSHGHECAMPYDEFIDYCMQASYDLSQQENKQKVEALIEKYEKNITQIKAILDSPKMPPIHAYNGEIYASSRIIIDLKKFIE